MSKRKITWWVLLIIYCGLLVYFTLLDRPITTSRLELRPFWALWELVVGNPEGLKGIAWYLENIALFIPFGLLLSARGMSLRAVVLVGFLASLSIELIQYLTTVGLAELDDLTANTIGTGICFGLWKMMTKIPEKARR